MNFETQHSKIEIMKLPELDEGIKHSSLLPTNVRAIVVGFSGTGKTNSVLSLLCSPNGLKFDTLYIYSKSLDQSKYKFLNEIFSDLKEVGYYTFSNNEQVIPPREAKPNSVMIFDDVSLESKKIVQEYFSSSRHKNIDVFYISQSYAQVPKLLIRDNSNFIILFPQDKKNLRYIHDNHVNSDMTFADFLRLCDECWSEKYGFLVIDKESPKNQGRYRKTFNTWVKFN